MRETSKAAKLTQTQRSSDGETKFGERSVCGSLQLVIAHGQPRYGQGEFYFLSPPELIQRALGVLLSQLSFFIVKTRFPTTFDAARSSVVRRAAGWQLCMHHVPFVLPSGLTRRR